MPVGTPPQTKNWPKIFFSEIILTQNRIIRKKWCFDFFFEFCYFACRYPPPSLTLRKIFDQHFFFRNSFYLESHNSQGNDVLNLFSNFVFLPVGPPAWDLENFFDQIFIFKICFDSDSYDSPKYHVVNIFLTIDFLLFLLVSPPPQDLEIYWPKIFFQKFFWLIIVQIAKKSCFEFFC